MADLSTTADLVLVTNRLCPYAQRAHIALAASGLKYETKVHCFHSICHLLFGSIYKLVIPTSQEVGLYGHGGKPKWFLELNPKGQVPVLILGGKYARAVGGTWSRDSGPGKQQRAVTEV